MTRKPKKLLPMTAEATCARLGLLLRPPGSDGVVDPDEPLLDTLRALRWVAEVDWKDDNATVLQALSDLSQRWGVDTIASPREPLDFEPLLRFAGADLARSGLALLRVENFVFAVCPLERGPEAAARLDALGAAEDGACLFPQEHPMDSGPLLLAAPRPKRGAAAKRQRLAELVSAEHPPPRCTTPAALTKLLARCTVGMRSPSRRSLAAWELVRALRTRLQDRQVSADAIRELERRAARRFHVAGDLAFVAFLDGLLAELGLSVIAVHEERLAVCRKSERDEAEELLVSFRLASGAPLVVQDVDGLEALERLDLALRPVDTSRDPGGQFAQKNAVSPTVFLDPSTWPPSARPLELPGDVRAAMIAYEDGVQIAKASSECFHRAGPGMPWKSFGRPVSSEWIRWSRERFVTWNAEGERLVWSGETWEPATGPAGTHRRVEPSTLGGGQPIDGPSGFQIVPLDPWWEPTASTCFYLLHGESASYSIVFLEMVAPEMRRHPHAGSISLAYAPDAHEVRCVVPVWSSDGERLWALRFSWASLAALPRHALPERR